MADQLHTEEADKEYVVALARALWPAAILGIIAVIAGKLKPFASTVNAAAIAAGVAAQAFGFGFIRTLPVMRKRAELGDPGDWYIVRTAPLAIAAAFIVGLVVVGYGAFEKGDYVVGGVVMLLDLAMLALVGMPYIRKAARP